MSQRSQFPYPAESLPASTWSSNAGTPILTPTGSILPTPYCSVQGNGPYGLPQSAPISPLASQFGTLAVGISPVPSFHMPIRAAPPRPSIIPWPFPPEPITPGPFPTAPGNLIVPGLPPLLPTNPMDTLMPTPVMSGKSTSIPSTMPSPIPSVVPSLIPTPIGSIRSIPAGPIPHGVIVEPPPGYVTANTSHYNLPFLPPPYRPNFVPSPHYIIDAREDYNVHLQECERQRQADEESLYSTKCRCSIM